MLERTGSKSIRSPRVDGIRRVMAFEGSGHGTVTSLHGLLCRRGWYIDVIHAFASSLFVPLFRLSHCSVKQ
jgi:hypothetical protein